MFTPDDIEELFEKRRSVGDRWVFTPKWSSPLKGYRYALTFLTDERRFVLSKQKLEPFVSVDDEELMLAFRSQLNDEEMADCMRSAINPPPDDDIPF